MGNFEMQLREAVFCRKYRPLMFYAFYYEEELKPLSSGIWLQEYFSFLYGETSMGVFGMAVDWLGFGYAALVASGGIIGYAKAGSVPSLAAGLFFGSLAGLGAYQVSQNPNNVWVSLITSGALTAVMGTRFYNSRKFMPAGLIAGVSLLMVGRLALKMLEKPQDK
ncbi:transmembrane protein 14C-like isoform 1-T1 [Cyanocitta cristata]